ncbi:MAG: hypothetical protein QOJ07_2933 [Thermoleophilaceae bacterium]|nr:hypothetical protein [Thermoleophilaceae bacterium]
MTATLGARLARIDRERFVGRGQELAFFDRLWVDEPPASVVLVHGPGGIGKSTLLRAISRRAEENGWTPVFIEGRDMPPVADALAKAVQPALDAERPLVVFDTWERMTALGGYLRRELLPALPAQAIVVLAGRSAPDPAWFEGGWEALTADLELAPLSDSESLELLAAAGVTDIERADEIVAWTGGSPLALTLAVDAMRDPKWSPEPGLERPETVKALIRQLAEAELRGGNVGALGVASITRMTTVDLLREVLPRTDSKEAYAWLAARTFAEPLGEGVTLHELVRRALHADLKLRHPEWERELRRRVADYFYSRASAGDLLLSIELAHLVESPLIRWGFSWEGSIDHRVDDGRPGDLDDVHFRVRGRLHPGWWAFTRRFFEEAPERVAIARGAEEELCGYQVSVTPNNAPAWADDDPLLGPWLAHARRISPDGNAVLWHDSIDFTQKPHLRVQAMLGMAGILRSGLDNPRYAYMPISPAMAAAIKFARATGAKHLPELDVDYHGQRLECHVLDYGPGGLLGFQRDWIYKELGLSPPAFNQPAGDADYAEAVRDALREFRVPHKLAASVLASGTGAEERAESVRALIRTAAEQSFGDTPNERLLYDILVRGYIDPAPSHEQAADELNVSRSTYFRRLKAAAERVAEHLAAAYERGPGTTQNP